MTIFRRRSRHITDRAPAVLEASTSSSNLLLAGSAELQNKNSRTNGDDNEDQWSTYSNKSSSSSSSSNGMDEEGSLALLARAVQNGYEVKHDSEDGNNVMVSMELPPHVPVNDITVRVDDGVLTVIGESASASAEAGGDSTAAASCVVEQAFQLDEQALDIGKLTANLSKNGVLTITAPRKDQQTSHPNLIQESLPITTGRKPPRITHPAFQDALRVIFDLPGVHLQDIYVTYTNGKLRVSANRHFGRVRSFKRTFAVDTQKFDATRLQVYLYMGQLTILVPAKELTGVSRTIEITNDQESKHQSRNEN